MNALLVNWTIILIIGFLLSRFLDKKKAFFSGLVSIIIASVITYGVHSFWISSGDIIWALVAVGYASFSSGMFSNTYYQ